MDPLIKVAQKPFDDTIKFSVTSKVVDENNIPLSDVNIYELQNPTKGVITDENGNFQILLSSTENDVVVSYVGQQQQYNASKIPNPIVFKENALDEVVITAPKPEEKKSSLWKWIVGGVLGVGIIAVLNSKKAKEVNL